MILPLKFKQKKYLGLPFQGRRLSFFVLSSKQNKRKRRHSIKELNKQSTLKTSNIILHYTAIKICHIFCTSCSVINF